MEAVLMLMRSQSEDALYVGTHVDNTGMQAIMAQIGFTPEPGTYSYTAPNGSVYESTWYCCSPDIDPRPTEV